MLATHSNVLGVSVIPWTSEYAFDEVRFRQHVNAQLSAGLEDLYIFGTAGEGYAVTDSQFLEIATAFHDVVRAAGQEPMVGVISLSMGTIIDRIEAASQLGVRKFQISMPSWGPLEHVEALTFFEEVLGSFPDLEFLHYNVARAKRQLTAADYRLLSDRHPNLVATKQSSDSMRHIASCMEQAPKLRHYFVDSGYAFGSLHGECGLIPSMPASNLEQLWKFVAAGTARDAEQLMRFQGELRRLTAGFQAVVGAHPRIDAAYDKALWKLHDPAFPLRILPPYEALPDDTTARFRAWLDEHEPRWSPGEPLVAG